MKDGTFQIAREYKRDGDRVRYYSLERSDWEELPAALVDWDATQKAEAEQQVQDQALAQKIQESARAKRSAASPASGGTALAVSVISAKSPLQ